MLFCSTDVFNAVQVEANNISEVIAKHHELPSWLEDWTQRLGLAADCAGMSDLLLEVEDRITDGMLSKKGAKKSKTAATNGSINSEGAEGAVAGGDEKVEAIPDASGSVWLDNEDEYNEFVGKKVRRSVLGEDGKPAGFANGSITGWLPARLSDFYSKETGQKAAVRHPLSDLYSKETGQVAAERQPFQAAVKSCARCF